MFCPCRSDRVPKQLQPRPTRGHSFFTKDGCCREGPAVSSPQVSLGQDALVDAPSTVGQVAGEEGRSTERVSSDLDSIQGPKSGLRDRSINRDRDMGERERERIETEGGLRASMR